MNNNEKVLKLLKDRLDQGQREYGQHIPLTGEKGRNNFEESLYEILDSLIYLACEIVTILQNRGHKWQDEE